MRLDERKKRILAAVVEDYINFAEPIGSRTLSKSHLTDLSPATIRNEMADLEDMGLLMQPHTSAGRVPTNLGYRLYVDQLMQHYRMSVEEINRVRALMQLRISEADVFIREMSNLFSRLTNYTVVTLAPGKQAGYISHFHFVKVEEYAFLAVLVTDTNAVRNKVIRSQERVEDLQLRTMELVLNERLANVKSHDINDELLGEIYKMCGGCLHLLPQVVSFVGEALDMMALQRVHIGGVSTLLSYPEYQDVERAKRIMSFLENSENLQNLLSGGKEYRGVRVIIGDENEAVELKNCSVVLSGYSAGESAFGAIGLIGPTRMDYSKAVSNLEFFTKQLNLLLEGEVKEDE